MKDGECVLCSSDLKANLHWYDGKVSKQKEVVMKEEGQISSSTMITMIWCPKCNILYKSASFDEVK